MCDRDSVLLVKVNRKKRKKKGKNEKKALQKQTLEPSNWLTLRTRLYYAMSARCPATQRFGFQVAENWITDRIRKRLQAWGRDRSLTRSCGSRGTWR